MKQEVFKLIVLGDGGVGKTTLLHRYVNREFIDSTTMTIGVEYFSKNVKRDGLICQLILTDITGQVRFRFLVDRFMKGASGALVLFDCTNMTSFVNIDKWVQLVRKYYQNLPLILVASKYDLKEFSMVGDILAKKLQKRLNMIDFIKTSAKSGLNVNLAFDILLDYLINSSKINGK